MKTGKAWIAVVCKICGAIHYIRIAVLIEMSYVECPKCLYHEYVLEILKRYKEQEVDDETELLRGLAG